MHKPRSFKGLGPKFGATVRKRYTRIERLLKMRRVCPNCGSRSLEREASGIWVCRKCGYKVAGGAYRP